MAKEFFETELIHGTNVKDYDLVIPNDVELLPKKAIAVMVGTAGDLHLVKPSGEGIVIPFALCPSRVFLNYPCIQIKSTGTTASDILVVYGE